MEGDWETEAVVEAEEDGDAGSSLTLTNQDPGLTPSRARPEPGDPRTAPPERGAPSTTKASSTARIGDEATIAARAGRQPAK